MKSNNHMEKEVLHRVLEFLKERDIQVGVLVTDQQQQISKWMRALLKVSITQMSTQVLTNVNKA